MEFHQIVTDGGAGDLICELVAVNWNITHHKDVHFHVWVPDYLLTLAKHLLPMGSTVRPFSKAKSKFRHDIEGMTTEWCSNHTPMRTHPVDYGFHMLSDRHIYRMKDKNYLQIKPNKESIKKYDLPKRYACIQATYAEPVKTMPIETFNAVVDWFISKDIQPVFLGKETSPAGYKDLAVKGVLTKANMSMGINLINKTDLLESAQIIAHSICMVGMDGGLTHLAGCTDTQIISGYSLVDPIHVAPIRYGSQDYKFIAIEPDDVPNKYYQTNFSGFKKGDFRKFPGFEKVVASLTPDKFIRALDENIVL